METLTKFDGARIELKKSDNQHEECKVYGTTWLRDNEVMRESIKICSKHPILHCEVGKYLPYRDVINYNNREYLTKPTLPGKMTSKGWSLNDERCIPSVVIERPGKLSGDSSIRVFTSENVVIGNVRKVKGEKFNSLKILDNEDKELYNIKGTDTQYWAELNINDSKKSQNVGVIRRSWGDSFRAGMENVDTYGTKIDVTTIYEEIDVQFPEGSEAQERALLVVAALFIDILWMKESTKTKCIIL